MRLNKNGRQKWRQGRKIVKKYKIDGPRRFVKFPLRKKKKYKKSGNGRKKKKRLELPMLINKGKVFGVPSTIKQLN